MSNTADITGHDFAPGQHVWTIFTDHVCQNVVSEVSAKYVRLKGRRSSWSEAHKIFASEQEARAALAVRLRERAASLLLAAEELENAR
jgi:hypothetical protein